MSSAKLARELSESNLISSAEGCKLYKTPQTSVDASSLTLQFICSEQEGKVAFHRKLKVYNSGSGFYVITRGTRCYVNNLMHMWFYK